MYVDYRFCLTKFYGDDIILHDMETKITRLPQNGQSRKASRGRVYGNQNEKTAAPKEKPNADVLGFGKYFTDHMFVMEYSPEKGWHDARIVPFGQPFSQSYIDGISLWGRGL